MRIYRTPQRAAFEVVNYVLFALFSITIIMPFVHALAISLSSPDAVLQSRVTLWPVELDTRAYRIILSSSVFLRSFLNTVVITVVKTTLSISICLAAGYALSSRHFVGVRIAFLFILVPMYFSGGLIPTYLTVSAYGLNNTYGALVLPNLITIFYIIVFRNAIARLPQEIIESAEMDGASEFTILVRIIVHLIVPMIMAFTIFAAVQYWNEWFNVLIYVRDKSKWTLQYMLRDIYLNPVFTAGTDTILVERPLNPQNIIMAAMMCTVLPIIVIYPFLQRFFIHGALVGAVKG
jgi:putative aldouronate transport system permease protein